MFTLLVGILIVAGSAFVFGIALFGRRPVPQPAMSTLGGHPDDPRAEVAPSGVEAAAQPPALAGDALRVGFLRRVLQRDESADHQPSGDVTLSSWVRTRSALVLTLVVVGLAAIIGCVLSALLVGFVLIVT